MPVIYVANFSTGLSSFEAARRTLEKYGPERTRVVFCDVKGDPKRDIHAAPDGTNWDGEDDDNYRFLEDAQRLLGVPILRLRHPQGLGVWGIIFRERAITIRGANIFAPCTKILKQEALDNYVANIRVEGYDVVQVLGLTALEDDRIQRFKKRVNADAEFPLTEHPLVGNCEISAWLRARGVEPPGTYELGFPHGNCGGACTKGGQMQWASLLQYNPGRYLYNEGQELWFNREINPNVTILRDRRGGPVKPITLRRFREEIEAGIRKPEPFEWGGCGCFTQTPQMIELQGVTT